MSKAMTWVIFGLVLLVGAILIVPRFLAKRAAAGPVVQQSTPPTSTGKKTIVGKLVRGLEGAAKAAGYDNLAGAFDFADGFTK